MKRHYKKENSCSWLIDSRDWVYDLEEKYFIGMEYYAILRSVDNISGVYLMSPPYFSTISTLWWNPTPTYSLWLLYEVSNNSINFVFTSSLLKSISPSTYTPFDLNSSTNFFGFLLALVVTFCSYYYDSIGYYCILDRSIPRLIFSWGFLIGEVLWILSNKIKPLALLI